MISKWITFGEKECQIKFSPFNSYINGSILNGFNQLEPYFNNQKYSEMKGFEYSYFTNWDDAIFLGIGNLNDVTFKNKEL